MVRSLDGKAMVSKEKQANYRLGVSMLLYLVKHLRPDIVNTVKELSKSLDGCTEASFRQMLHVIKYVLDTNNMSLKMTRPTFRKRNHGN